MKKPIIIGLLLVASTVLIVCSTVFSSSSSNEYKQQLIDPGSNPPMIDGVELGIGRNDGVLRLYTTRERSTSQGYEYSFSNGKWSGSGNFSADAYCSSPTIVDLKKEGSNALYLGGWNDLGVLMTTFKKDWSKPEVLPGSAKKGNILAMKAGDGRNDGVKRLYVAHWSENGLIEYSWNKTTFSSLQLMNSSVGRFAIGQGRNDGIQRIYAVERGGRDLHEFTWNGSAFADQVIFTGRDSSKGSVHVADGRGDNVNRVYAWVGGLYELTYEKGKWTSRTLDDDNVERYYINAGSIRKDKQPRVYVSVKKKGLLEYAWSRDKKRFEVDVITSATGGSTIGDGRGDGKNRLYVARGTKDNFDEAAVVEMWE